jgi:Heparinase II/III-like protein
MHAEKRQTHLSRRELLVGSAALAGAAALSHPIFAFARGVGAGDIDSAAPRGKQRNLLSKSCSPEKLKEVLIPQSKYRPYPTIHDRAAWEGLRAETRSNLLAGGEKYLGYKWPEMPATVFLEYARNGNRTDYENLRNARMRALQSLVFAECVENRGRFLDDITNGVWATCEESFWGVPAHLYIQKADLGLPDPRDPIVDLFAAQTSALLATTVYVLESTLDTVSPQLRERVYFETERRILEPLLAQNFMWMGLPGGKPRHDLPWIDVPEGKVQPVNNWDAWICWNWLTSALLVDRDESRRRRSVGKILQCLDKFINTYPDDGGCEEGPGYWNVAAGAMFDSLELLYSVTSSAIDIYSNPLIAQMALYMNRVHINGDYYLNQGDASPIIHLDVDKMYRFGRRLKNQDLIVLAVSSLPAHYQPETLVAIFTESELRAQPPAKARLLRDTWLPDSRIMAARRKAESADGLYLACIAADNGKSHSHNDTGSFWVYSQGLPVLMDMGQETYQKKSFDAHRYEIPSTQSAYHNLPTIGGVQQGVGPMFRATDVAYESNENSAQLAMELATAYPAQAHLKSWRRIVRLDRDKNTIDISDSYLLTEPVPEIILNLMTACEVKESGEGRLTLISAQGAPPTSISFDPGLLRPTVETIPLENTELKRNWGGQIYRIQLKTIATKTAGQLNLAITQQ